MTRHATKRYKDNWGTPPEVVDLVKTIAQHTTGAYNVLDVTWPEAPGLAWIDLDLDFRAPFCGKPRLGYLGGSLEDARQVALFCNPPGDARGLHVRNAIDWAVAHYHETGRTVVVALFNESALTYRKLVSAEQAMAPGCYHFKCAAGIFRKRVAWIDPDTGLPGKAPPHHGALFVASWDPHAARNVMHRAGLLAFRVDHVLEAP